RYTLYLSPEELATLRERAGRTKTPAVSAYIRQAALGRAPGQAIPTVNREAYRELAGLAANLNQVARHLNQGGIVTAGPGQQFSRDLAELTELVRRLRLDLTLAR
ncbi:MAG TPA: plasmid mobilization relaxosome protein MobC, partial [Chloroflexota bacterium]